MTNVIEWYSGIDNHKKCTLFPDSKEFKIELLENEFQPKRDLDLIIRDNLLGASKGRKIEILFSGGVDSEFVARTCIKYNIPFELVTLIIYAKGMIINTHDLYYAENFFKEFDIKPRKIKFDATDFYENGKHYQYIEPYSVFNPHVASHFWLIEQCHSFPVLGGDWPWVHVEKADRVLSPLRVSFHSYERFMKDKGIEGMGNVIGSSFESTYRLMELQIENHHNNASLAKQGMFRLTEPRLRSYGWETVPYNVFNMKFFKEEMVEKIGIIDHEIIWGKKVSDLIKSTTNRNKSFI